MKNPIAPNPERPDRSRRDSGFWFSRYLLSMKLEGDTAAALRAPAQESEQPPASEFWTAVLSRTPWPPPAFLEQVRLAGRPLPWTWDGHELEVAQAGPGFVIGLPWSKCRQSHGDDEQDEPPAA